VPQMAPKAISAAVAHVATTPMDGGVEQVR